MRIILTESQIELIEAIIAEAAKPMSTKIEVGGFIEIVYTYQDTEKNNTLEVIKKYGSGQYVEVSNSGGSYIVNVGGSLDVTDNTFVLLKDGKYVDGSTDANGKVIPPKVINGAKIKIKNITQVNIYSPNKVVVDEILTDLGETNKSNNNQKNADDEEFEKRRVERRANRDAESKEIMKMAYADPNIRKLFSHQPSLLGGLIKLGKKKGLAHIGNLLGRYKDDEKDGEKGGKDKKEFLRGHKYSYQTISPVRITYGTKTIKLLSGETYSVRFDGKVFNGSLKVDNEKVDYYIKVNKKSPNNTYKGTVTVKFIERGNNSPDREEERSEDIVVKFK